MPYCLTFHCCAAYVSLPYYRTAVLPYCLRYCVTASLSHCLTASLLQVLYNAAISFDSETVVTSTNTWQPFDVYVLNGTLPTDQDTGDPGPVVTTNPSCFYLEVNWPRSIQRPLS